MSNSISYTPQSFVPILKKLILTPDLFTLEDVELAIHHLTSSPGADSIQISSFLTALKFNKLDSRADVIALVARLVSEQSMKLERSESQAIGSGMICDIVGTGGDGKNTYNVSTTAGIVAAGTGCRVYKHGNKAATSSSGSADILLSLDCPVTSMPPTAFASVSSTSNFLFLFAPLYHPTMAKVAPIRKLLGFPTIFNLLGPLINPVKPEAMIVGVHSKFLGPIFIETLRLLGIKSAWVVCGEEGLDEISPEGKTDVWELKNDQITQKSISPADFGLPSNSLSTVAGGSPTENAATLIALLNNELPTSDPIENFVIINTAALLVVTGKTNDLKQGVIMARESIKNGGAKEALRLFQVASQKAAGIKIE